MTRLTPSACTDSLRRRIRARARGRGAAMVEGVVVALFLVLVFFLLVGISGLYKTKLVVMQDARYRGVHNATNNCEPLGRGYAPERPPIFTDDIPEDAAGSSLAGFSIDLVRSVQEGFGVSRIESRGRFAFGVPSALNPIAGEVSSNNFMLCNEVPSRLNVFQAVGNAVKGFWDTIKNDVGPLIGDMLRDMVSMGGGI